MFEIVLEVFKESMLPPIALWPRRALSLGLAPWRLLKRVATTG